jgi:hypothetical protein
MKTPKFPYVGDKQIRELLQAFACPTPFHAVRTRFLANIATPRFDASPIEAIKALWNGDLPEFEDTDQANDLFGALLSFWNHLTQHQSRSKPFRLARQSSKGSFDDLKQVCQIRTEEIEGFVDGLFGTLEELDLPERALEGMEHLGKINAMLHGVLGLAENPEEAAEQSELAGMMRNVNELTRIAEKEMHAVILSCVRARREALKRTVH